MSDSAEQVAAAPVRGQPDADTRVSAPPEPKPNGAPAPAPAAPEEVDVWWGAYSGRTMLPSMIICLALTGLIAVGVWAWVPRGFMRLAFIGLAGALWLAQAVRFIYRFFGVNYRLTSRRLFSERGFLHTEFAEAPLTEVARVGVKRNSFEKLVGVGRIYIYYDGGREPLVLDGVRNPEAVANLIREWKQVANDSKRGMVSA